MQPLLVEYDNITKEIEHKKNILIINKSYNPDGEEYKKFIKAVNSQYELSKLCNEIIFELDSRIYHAKKKKQPKSIEAERQIVSSGTAFFINKEGYLISNFHVIEACQTISIKNSLVETDAKTLFIDEVNDFAVLKSETSFSHYASFRGG